MPDNTIDLTLKVTDDGSVTIDKFNQKINTLETNATAAGGTPGGGGIGGLTAELGGMINPTTIAIGAIIGLGVAAKEFIAQAAEAEQIEKRMAFQIQQVGYSFKDVQPYIDSFADSILKTTRFSDEAAREGLGRMMEYTGDLEKATKGVQLAMDMATQTGKGYDEMIVLVGMAMNGNVERLGRWVPELKNLDDTLGKNASAAEKAAYAMKLLNEKFGGAAQNDLETYSGKLAQLKNEWGEVKEKIGTSLLPLAKDTVFIMGWWLDRYNALFKSAALEESKAFDAAAALKGIQGQRKEDPMAKAGREAGYKAMIKAAEDAYKIEQEYAKKRAQLRGNEYELLEIEKAEELEKVRKAKGDEYYVWEYYDLKKIELDKKTAAQLQAVWLEYYEKQKSDQDKAIGVANLYGVPTTASMTMDFKQFEKDWGEALKGPLTKGELDEIQKAIIANAQAFKEYFSVGGKDWADKANDAFKKTVEKIEDMRKEADIAAGTQYRLAFDDSEVVRAMDELESIHEWLKYICDENKWQIKIKFTGEGSEELPISEKIASIQKELDGISGDQNVTLKFSRQGAQAEGGGGRSGGAGSAATRQGGAVNISPTFNVKVEGPTSGKDLAEYLDKKLAEMWEKNQSSLRRTMTSKQAGTWFKLDPFKFE